jgi:D-alanyl-D-alanine carboxypeptidase
MTVQSGKYVTLVERSPSTSLVGKSTDTLSLTAMKQLSSIRSLGSLLLAIVLFQFPSTAASIAATHAWSQTDSLIVNNCVRETMRRDDVPAVSIAIVRNGQVAHARAYGEAEIAGNRGKGRRAVPGTRFPIGSVTKEFTAAAILLLVDQGKLSLNDPVSKFIPALSESTQVNVRELLSHTSGYQDYFPQEYIPLRTQKATTVDAILKTWAKKPLDFRPGTEWQYSGTNYVIAGRIVEIVSGESFENFLIDNILRPEGILDARFTDQPNSSERDAVGYYRFALGPPHRAPVAGRNWLFAMGDLEMTAKDIALWDISVMNETLLSHASYKALSTEVKTSSGKSTGYALGLFVRHFVDSEGKQHQVLYHPGEISGFRSANFIVSDDKTALVVLTNAEYSDATNEIARQLQELLGTFSPETAGTENSIESRAHGLLLQLARGTINRSELSLDASQMFTPTALTDIRNSLVTLGRLKSVKLESTQLRGGMKHYALIADYELRSLQIAEYDLADGRIEQFFIDGS